MSIAPEVLSVPSNENVSLIKDLPVSFSGLGALLFLFPNIKVFQQIICNFATNKKDYFGYGGRSEFFGKSLADQTKKIQDGLKKYQTMTDSELFIK